MIQIPVYMPTYNEKIRVNLWHQEPSSLFILDGEEKPLANVPEFPNAHDHFNLKTLLSKEGSMDPIWFNMYGNRAKEIEAGSLINSSAYMGRVQMSLHLIPSENPKLQNTSIQEASKRNDKQYKLWVDVYEMTHCDEELLDAHDDQTSIVTVQAFLMGEVSEKEKA